MSTLVSSEVSMLRLLTERPHRLVSHRNNKLEGPICPWGWVGAEGGGGVGTEGVGGGHFTGWSPCFLSLPSLHRFAGDNQGSFPPPH